tara:strand:+ start:2273 stop:2467 length:195 start_codon:yes stop_codon:yes gene_type:complete
MFTYLLNKVNSIELPSANSKNTLITLTVIGSGYLIYNYGKDGAEYITNKITKLYNQENDNEIST